MGRQIRLGILLVLREHDKSGSADYKDDTQLANELGQPVDEIQRQLRILGDQEYVDLTEQFGPSYSAIITPRGLLYLEELEDQVPPPQKPPMGFKRPNENDC